MYAIVKDGGVQRQVRQGDVLNVEHRLLQAKETLVFDQILAVGSEGNIKIGTPYVAGAQVTAEVIGAVKAAKVMTHKYRRREKSHNRRGHRQKYLKVKITAIQAN